MISMVTSESSKYTTAKKGAADLPHNVKSSFKLGFVPLIIQKNVRQ